jgi:hypothetical protein
MSADVVSCPQCGTNLQNNTSIAGQVVACPQCQSQLQMPSLVQVAAAVDDLPPTIDTTSTSQSDSPSAAIPSVGQFVQPDQESTASLNDRLRKRKNPLAIFFGVIIVMILIAACGVTLMWDRSEKANDELSRQMTGNWELVPGQSQLARWEFAFHLNGQFEMALGNDVNKGQWKVESAQGLSGEVSIIWPDDAPETMRVRFESGIMYIDLDSVGKFRFRSALP